MKHLMLMLILIFTATQVFSSEYSSKNKKDSHAIDWSVGDLNAFATKYYEKQRKYDTIKTEITRAIYHELKANINIQKKDLLFLLDKYKNSGLSAQELDSILTSTYNTIRQHQITISKKQRKETIRYILYFLCFIVFILFAILALVYLSKYSYLLKPIFLSLYFLLGLLIVLFPPIFKNTNKVNFSFIGFTNKIDIYFFTYEIISYLLLGGILYFAHKTLISKRA